MKRLYMAVTADQYELPVAVEESAQRLSEKMGISVSAVKTSISRKKNGKTRGIKFLSVEVEED